VLTVNEIVSEIVAASAEQRSDIDEINRALEQMDHASRGNTALAEQAAAAAAALVEEARGLTAIVSRFRRSAVPAYSGRPGDAMPQALGAPRPLGGEPG